MATPKRLVLIDGHAVVFRAFYAFPHLTNSEGELVNAVYGFCLILLNVIVDLEPTHILVTFDRHEPTFRHEAFEEYKANRDETPEELRNQEPLVRKFIEAMNIPMFDKPGYEADDLIGTLACEACKDTDTEVVIVTGDKDLLQLVDDACGIQVYIPGRSRTPSLFYDEEAVVEKMGVRHDQIVDYKGFAGDSSDNIPGIKGVGPKTAISLLSAFESMEGVYEALGMYKAGKPTNFVASHEEFKDSFKEKGVGLAALKKVIGGMEMAFKSRELARIVTDAPVELSIEDCKVSGYEKKKVIELFEDLGFVSLIKRLPKDEFEMDVQEALF